MFFSSLILSTLVLLSLWSKPVGAENGFITIRSNVRMSVHEEPDSSSRIIFYLYPQSVFQLGPEVGELSEFRRIRFKKNDKDKKWRLGYVWSDDLSRAPDEVEQTSQDPEWGVGVTFFSGLVESAGRNFTTEDEVTYTTTKFAGNSSAFLFSAQVGFQDFWRFGFGRRIMNYTSKSASNVTPNATQPITLKHTFISLSLAKGWTVLNKKWLNAGIGTEYAKSTESKLTINKTDFPVDPEDEPLYFGLFGFIGTQWKLSPRVTVGTEAKLVYYGNRSPTVLGYEAGGTALFWF